VLNRQEIWNEISSNLKEHLGYCKADREFSDEDVKEIMERYGRIE